MIGAIVARTERGLRYFIEHPGLSRIPVAGAIPDSGVSDAEQSGCLAVAKAPNSARYCGRGRPRTVRAGKGYAGKGCGGKGDPRVPAVSQ